MHHNLLDDWSSSIEYEITAHDITPAKFLQIANLLLERPNLNSSHLFRADILFDSAANLQTVYEKATLHDSDYAKSLPDPPTTSQADHENHPGHVGLWHETAEVAKSYTLTAYSTRRTVIRRLVPRKPQVDKPLVQTCLIYTDDEASATALPIVVIYLPHAASEEQIPWYHPRVRALAYQYRKRHDRDAKLSIHYQLFPEAPEVIPDRLHRTLLSLLHTFVRLSKLESPQKFGTASIGGQASARPLTAAALKDTVLPQHIVQDTYSRLKQTYAADLIARWVEKTDPCKHVFEDLSIAAFLIELWGATYKDGDFPGFVDVACGNGVLVYILVKEGFRGCGFDARRRRTWDVLGIDDCLEEKLCIPKPYLDCLTPGDLQTLPGVRISDGVYDAGTFIISNHADELTLWTPILAALSCVENYLPFLAIPCCSHAFSGAKHRFSPKEVGVGLGDAGVDDTSAQAEQPLSGDLKAMRAQKAKAASHADAKSAYACLTRKTVNVAEELGFEVDVTLMRIPSTRNIGVLGNWRDVRTKEAGAGIRTLAVPTILERECSATGGVYAAAKIWVERAKTLIQGTGRGKTASHRATTKSPQTFDASDPAPEREFTDHGH